MATSTLPAGAEAAPPSRDAAAEPRTRRAGRPPRRNARLSVASNYTGASLRPTQILAPCPSWVSIRTMSSCRTCGKELPSGATVCPDDGTKVPGAEPTMMLEDNDLEPVAAAAPASTAAAKAADLKPGQDVSGYLIDAKIGQGGMGVVYGAHHPRIGKKVAIKVLSPMFCGDPTTVERFEQEA